eukprot:gnl/Chilomastix_cuspidata/4865.p1 GENE.gnl/Chilomastix_cuspidata/4865~~gnl/Chilomastix_cuspidata/4865.p1  ORF type:complete len:142 (-),score=5.71 gnl/Chilomastix_cuspidata/4865:4-390(-)
MSVAHRDKSQPARLRKGSALIEVVRKGGTKQSEHRRSRIEVSLAENQNYSAPSPEAPTGSGRGMASTAQREQRSREAQQRLQGVFMQMRARGDPPASTRSGLAGAVDALVATRQTARLVERACAHGHV